MRPLFAAICLLALAACESERPATRAGATLDRAGTEAGAAVAGAARETGAAVGRAGNWVQQQTR